MTDLLKRLFRLWRRTIEPAPKPIAMLHPSVALFAAKRAQSEAPESKFQRVRTAYGWDARVRAIALVALAEAPAASLEEIGVAVARMIFTALTAAEGRLVDCDPAAVAKLRRDVATMEDTFRLLALQFDENTEALVAAEKELAELRTEHAQVTAERDGLLRRKEAALWESLEDREG